MEETVKHHAHSIQSWDSLRLERHIEHRRQREDQLRFEDTFLASDIEENWKEHRGGKYDKIERDMHIYYYLSCLFHSQHYNLQPMSGVPISHSDKNPQKS